MSGESDYYSQAASVGADVLSFGMNRNAAKRQQRRGFEQNLELMKHGMIDEWNHYNQSLADQKAMITTAWNRQKKERRYWAQHGKSIEVEALRRAGLNPILAAGGLGGSSAKAMMQSPNVAPNKGSGRSGSSSGGGYTAHKSQAIQNYAALKLLDAQTKNIEQNTAKTSRESEGTKLNNQAQRLKNIATAKAISLEHNENWFKRTGVYKYGVAPIKSIFGGAKVKTPRQNPMYRPPK